MLTDKMLHMLAGIVENYYSVKETNEVSREALLNIHVKAGEKKWYSGNTAD